MISGFKKEGLKPPLNNAVEGSQKAKIKRLVDEYVKNRRLEERML